MTRPDRNGAVDALRMVALVGICVVNLPFLALPPGAMFAPADPGADAVAQFLVAWLVQGKVFLLFSFVFGWGVHVQERAAERAGAGFAGRYRRRLAGLAVLGALHAVLVFAGDILVLYALLGLAIWPFRTRSAAGLWRLARAMVPVAVIGIGLLGVLLPAELPPEAGPGQGGSFGEAVLWRLGAWPETFVFLLLFQGPLAFGAFAAGIAAARVGLFEEGSPHRERLGRALPLLLGLGLPLNLAYAMAVGGMLSGEDGLLALAAFAGLGLGAPLLAAAYLSLILSWSEGLRLPDGLVQAGRNSLSVYVLQGIVAGAIFGGYGVGLFGQVGQAGLAALAVAVALVAMAAVGIWAARFGRGPLEAMLRAATYR